MYDLETLQGCQLHCFNSGRPTDNPDKSGGLFESEYAI